MLVWGMPRVSLTGVPSRWHPPQSLGNSMVEVGDLGADGRRTLGVPWEALHPGGVGIVLGGGGAVEAGGVLLLLAGVAVAAGYGREFFGVRDFLDVGVAGGA